MDPGSGLRVSSSARVTEPRARLLAALDSDGELLRQLILEWMPIVQVRVARILGRWSRARRRRRAR
jgi:hypothetical protein